MAFKRGNFGIEYNPRPWKPESSGLGWIVAIVAVVAFISLVCTWVSRYRSAREDSALAVAADQDGSATATNAPVNVVVEPPPLKVEPTAVEKRPHQLQVLLMRREAAVKARDLEMEASTIESIRQLPGAPAADLDDSLARRLGNLNLMRLWVKRNRQWVKEVEVKRGDSASRIAFENGTTLAALEKLNGGSVERLFAGKKIFVMNHPHFQLVVHRRTQTADLMLNDRFFKRYDLIGKVTPAEGRYELEGSFRSFLKSVKLDWQPADRAELDLLLPVGTPVLVSEF